MLASRAVNIRGGAARETSTQRITHTQAPKCRGVCVCVYIHVGGLQEACAVLSLTCYLNWCYITEAPVGPESPRATCLQRTPRMRCMSFGLFFWADEINIIHTHTHSERDTHLCLPRSRGSVVIRGSIPVCHGGQS